MGGCEPDLCDECLGEDSIEMVSDGEGGHLLRDGSAISGHTGGARGGGQHECGPGILAIGYLQWDGVEFARVPFSLENGGWSPEIGGEAR